MNTFKLTALVAIAMVAAAANAQPIEVKVPAGAAAPASTLTRAEVLADVHIWNLSGLAELHRRGRSSPDTDTPEYRTAKARYDALRSSSEFPALVARLQDNPFAQIRAR